MRCWIGTWTSVYLSRRYDPLGLLFIFVWILVYFVAVVVPCMCNLFFIRVYASVRHTLCGALPLCGETFETSDCIYLFKGRTNILHISRILAEKSCLGPRFREYPGGIAPQLLYYTDRTKGYTECHQFQM